MTEEQVENEIIEYCNRRIAELDGEGGYYQRMIDYIEHAREAREAAEF